ncbi:hypothetical protein EDC96DRAFT_545353 [Choanephora cucurbitarum]|nr:hypothetical protein EDC96DRAFT_545353 [Choanephora cucurbitarum]
MRISLFDPSKDRKSKKLSKRLQKEADNEWQKILKDRKQQEELDEITAKELQAIEDKRIALLHQSDANNPFLNDPPSNSLSEDRESSPSHIDCQAIETTIYVKRVYVNDVFRTHPLHGVIEPDSAKLVIDNDGNAAQTHKTLTKPDKSNPAESGTADSDKVYLTDSDIHKESNQKFTTHVIDTMASLFQHQIATEFSRVSPGLQDRAEQQDTRGCSSSALMTGTYPSAVTIVPAMFQQTVYPTRMVRAGPPCFSDEVQLSKVPQESDSIQKDDIPIISNELVRHITVTSIYPEQRTWIQIYPTDTGKDLANRIAILASYRTRRVTKMVTPAGKSIAIDRTLVVNELSDFNQGEPWRIEWVPLNHRC